MAPRQGYASIGITVEVGTNDLNYVTQIGDIGGEPNMLDATCLKDSMQHNVAGVQKTDSFDITYLFDNSDTKSDYRVLKGLQDAKNPVDVKVTMPDGTKFASKGTVTNKVSGASVDNLIEAVCSVALQQDWAVTNPAGG